MKLYQTIGIAATCGLVAVAGAIQSSSNAAEGEAVLGTVTGKVEFEGERPEPKKLQITEKQAEGCCPPGESVKDDDQTLVIDKDGGLANVVITVEIEGKKPEVPAEPVPIDQIKCRFYPHVSVVPAGATVAYLNSDGVSHNIHTYSLKNEPLNNAVSGGNKLTQKLDKVEPVKVSCDYHPWMLSWIYVTDAPKFTVSGEDGTFKLEGLEPGEYELELWHEALGKAQAKAVVAEDGSSEMVSIKMGEKKKGGRRR